MCAEDSVEAPPEIPVSKKRVATALRIILKTQQVLTDEQFFEILDELQWFNLSGYNSSGRIQVQLTDLQQVALAAALAAYWEGQHAR